MKKATLLLCLFCLGLCASSQADPNNPRVVIRTYFVNGDITLELFPGDAPETVQNFLDYVDSGFYDGLVFHRAIDDFMIQGGSFEWAYSNYPYLRKRTEGLQDPIPNESDNGLLNMRGTISMALLPGDPNSGTSGFFINQRHNSHLDGLHTVFGEVLSDMGFIDWLISLDKMQIPALGLSDVPYVGTVANPYFVYVYETILVPEADWFEADIDYNGVVDEWDLHVLAVYWLSSAELGDIEVTGDIDFDEFAQFARSWRRTSVWYRDFASDIDNNEEVNFKDFSYLARDWGKNDVHLYGDLNLDSTVDEVDLSLFADDWLKQAD